jgi:transglutaminase-like putative cysteine protease
MMYRVKHVTTYRYGDPVLLAHHQAHLVPRQTLHQTCLRAQLRVTPNPSEIDESGVDYYGNPTAFFGHRDPHSMLTVQVNSKVEVRARELPAADCGEPWQGVHDPLARLSGETLVEVADFCFDSPFVALSAEIRAYAERSFVAGRPMIGCLRSLNSRIRNEFAYDPEATTLATPLSQVLAQKRGVCQDFAHLFIACARAMGLPARYVSGYLLTRPPPGKQKLRGSDASHAWVSVFVPEFGWVDFDPTNDCLPNLEHVVLGWGRDYDDVSPLRGVVLGGGEHRLKVGVDVEPVNA